MYHTNIKEQSHPLLSLYIWLLNKYLQELLFVELMECESEVTQSCPTVWDSMDCSPPGSSIHGLCQARGLEWVAISFCRGASGPSGQTRVSCIVDRCFNVWATLWSLIIKQLKGDTQDGLSLVTQMGKSLPVMREMRFDPWVGKIPWRRKWQPTPVLLPGKAHGWRSLAGYSPWGFKEWDTTERLHFSLQDDSQWYQPLYVAY